MRDSVLVDEFQYLHNALCSQCLLTPLQYNDPLFCHETMPAVNIFTEKKDDPEEEPEIFFYDSPPLEELWS